MLYPIVTLGASLVEARRTRAEQKRLRAELASFRTPAERAELDAIIARSTPETRAQLAQQAGLRSVA